MYKDYLTRPAIKYCVAVFLTLFFLGCSTISKYDQYAYTQATSLKVDALHVMDNATEQYEVHKAEVDQVMMSIDKMLEYEKNRPKNAISEKMWVVLRDTSGHLFGGFVNRWEKAGTLHPIFIKEAQDLVSKSFDQISQLESGKIKSSQVSIN